MLFFSGEKWRTFYISANEIVRVTLFLQEMNDGIFAIPPTNNWWRGLCLLLQQPVEASFKHFHLGKSEGQHFAMVKCACDELLDEALGTILSNISRANRVLVIGQKESTKHVPVLDSPVTDLSWKGYVSFANLHSWPISTNVDVLIILHANTIDHRLKYFQMVSSGAKQEVLIKSKYVIALNVKTLKRIRVVSGIKPTVYEGAQCDKILKEKHVIAFSKTQSHDALASLSRAVQGFVSLGTSSLTECTEIDFFDFEELEQEGTICFVYCVNFRPRPISALDVANGTANHGFLFSFAVYSYFSGSGKEAHQAQDS